MEGKLLTKEDAAQYQPQAKKNIGYCTRGLNLDAKITRFSKYYDYHSTHLDKYYFKHSMVERNEGLRRPSSQAGEYEYGDEDSDLAIRCTRTFYQFCSQCGVSTTNPFHFWKDMNSLVDENHTSRVEQAALFLLGCEENRFLFDSSYATQLPDMFITRASVQRANDSIPFLLEHPEYEHPLRQPMASLQLPKTKDEYKRLIGVMEEQILELQLFLPNKRRFLHNYSEICAHYSGIFQKRAQSACRVAKQYRSKKVRYPEGESPHMGQILSITKYCLEWYVVAQQHLKGKFIKQSQEEFDMLQNCFNSPPNGDYHRDFNRLITAVTDRGCHPFLDLNLYTLISQHRSALTTGVFQNWTLYSDYTSGEPNAEVKGSDKTARMRYRWNLLLFQKLHHEFSKLGLCRESEYFFEKTEPYSDEAYPDMALLDESPESEAIEQYILSGHSGKEKVFHQLHELVSDAEYSVTISPFDVMRHRLWNTTYQDLEQFRRSSKKRPPSVDPSSSGEKRMGKSTTIHTMITDAMKVTEDSHLYFDRYYNLVFCHGAGFGTGLTTYDWAYEVARMIDILLAEPSFASLKDIAATDAKNAELVELSIHQYFLDDLNGKTLKIIKSLGKFLLYTYTPD